MYDGAEKPRTLFTHLMQEKLKWDLLFLDGKMYIASSNRPFGFRGSKNMAAFLKKKFSTVRRDQDMLVRGWLAQKTSAFCEYSRHGKRS